MDDEDFESLLDAAFGIYTTQDNSGGKAAGGACDPPAQAQQQMALHTSTSLEPSPSPAASPVHTYPPVGSPCWSGASMQMHASPPHDNSASSAEYNPQLLYSPVREGSPSPEEEVSPVFDQGPQEAVALQQSHMSSLSQAGDSLTAQPQQQPAAQVYDQAAARRHHHHHHHQQQQQHSLCSLPREVQMRVLCCLSADSLTSLAQTCTQLSSLCNEPVLWRRLFVHRWGKNVRHSNAHAWKVRYMERDSAELEAAGAGGQGGDVIHDIFLQALKAKRHKALGVGAVDDLMLVEDDVVAARVLAWRKSRGFATQQGPGSDAQPQRPADLALPSPSQGSGHRAPAGFSGYSLSHSRPRIGRRSGPGYAANVGEAQGSSKPVQLAGNAAAAGAAVTAAAGARTQEAADAAGTPSVALSGSSNSAGPAGASGSGLAAAAAAQHSMASNVAAAEAGAGAAGQGSVQTGSSSKGVKRRRRMPPRRWTQIGNVFCDEQTGWVHVCDETCSEKIVERSSGLLVCPISGTCSARLLTCAEEDEEEGDRDPDKEYREEEFGGERGRLARAFAAGYYCSDEKELMRECGVCLPR